jgi:RHS repeat-associated protein
MTITTNGNINQPYTYTSREYDAETGMYFYRARYYDPKAGRFVTKDPIGFVGGDVNLYGYVLNNPVRGVDPLGLKVTSRWVTKPYAHGRHVEYLGWHFDIGNWKWIPPGFRIATADFYGSATISFEIECTDDVCQKSWTISRDINGGTNFGIPIRVKLISHWIITAAQSAKAANEAYKLLDRWSEIQAGYYLCSDSTTWCLVSSFSGGGNQ